MANPSTRKEIGRAPCCNCGAKVIIRLTEPKRATARAAFFKCTGELEGKACGFNGFYGPRDTARFLEALEAAERKARGEAVDQVDLEAEPVDQVDLEAVDQVEPVPVKKGKRHDVRTDNFLA